MERELTLAPMFHPEFIGNDWQLVDHPTIRAFAEGDATLGWEGDTRLAVYLFKPTKTFVLWRLENHGEYLPLARIDGDISPASVNNAIRNLIRIDQRRGFSAIETVEDAQEKAWAARDAARREEVAQVADKLHYGLAHSHLPGVDITRPRQLVRTV